MSHERWSRSTIRRFAAALYQEVEQQVIAGEFDDNPADENKSLLWRLKHDRPRPAPKVREAESDCQIASQKKAAKNKHRKRIRLQELRLLISVFRSKADAFSLWIVGYIIFASRLGWRPGEIVALERHENLLRAAAEKYGNGRGLTDTCEINISAYIERSPLFTKTNLVSQIEKWIADIDKWQEYYGGRGGLQDNINSRLATACKTLGIRRTCTYTFRHFAISCMKASGFSRSEIAVIINHASNRTATEHYGQRRFLAVNWKGP